MALAAAAGRAGRGRGFSDTFGVGEFIAASIFLEHLAIGGLDGSDFFDSFPPSLITFIVDEVSARHAAPFIPAIHAVLPRLANLTRLRVGNWCGVAARALVEDVTAVEQGIELVKV
ncbi:hypothetical protein JCM10213v2_005286 [Rhodosporidiobolus nylandii]